LAEPRLDSLRSGDHQRPGPAGKLRVEQEKRQAAEMIAVKMCDQDEVDIVARNTQPLQRRQRRRAAIDQEIDAVAGDVKTGVGPAAGAEGVAAADKPQLHGSLLQPR
jgi:hypothetical protein